MLPRNAALRGFDVSGVECYRVRRLIMHLISGLQDPGHQETISEALRGAGAVSCEGRPAALDSLSCFAGGLLRSSRLSCAVWLLRWITDEATPGHQCGLNGRNGVCRSCAGQLQCDEWSGPSEALVQSSKPSSIASIEDRL